MLRKAATDTSKFRLITGSKSFMKHPIIEKYGAYAIDLGIQNEMDTELNMSPEGKLRRKALEMKDQSDKKFDKFGKKYMEGESDKKLNLTLKKVAP